jgi:hypothetical protein
MASATIAEVAHPPFGYLLILGGSLHSRRPTAITDFFAFDVDEKINLSRRLPVLPTLWMAPGDYRDQDAIDRDIIRNWLSEWWHPEEAEERAHVLFDRYGHPLAERLSPGHW